MAVDELEREAHDEHARAGEHQPPGKPGEPGKPGGKDDAGAESKVKKHRDVIVIMLTVVGVVIAWLTWRARSSANAAGVAATTGTTPSGGNEPPTAGGAPDGLAAALSNMSDELARIDSRLGAGGHTHPPTGFDFSSMNHSWANEPLNAPARFLFGRAAVGLRYIRDRATGFIYQINPNGKRFRLTAAEYAELGRPKYVDFGRPHPVTPVRRRRRRRVGQPSPLPPGLQPRQPPPPAPAPPVYRYG